MKDAPAWSATAPNEIREWAERVRKGEPDPEREELREGAGPLFRTLLDLVDGMDAVVVKHRDRLERLEEELAELRSSALRFRDVWRRSQNYGRGDLVIHGGQLWHADKTSTAEKPGSSDAWTLLHKQKGTDK